MNLGKELRISKHGLLTTLAAGTGREVDYVMEGSVFVGGAVIQWLRDEMGLLANAADSEYLAAQVPDSGGVTVVPAFTGLGAPYWDMYARGAIFGLTRGAGRAHIVRAALESIAYQCRDLTDALAADTGLALGALRVDGGASANNFHAVSGRYAGLRRAAPRRAGNHRPGGRLPGGPDRRRLEQPGGHPEKLGPGNPLYPSNG